MDPANPKTLFPSTSAVTYWQIELQEGPVQGTSVLKQSSRWLKHCLTGRILLHGGEC